MCIHMCIVKNCMPSKAMVYLNHMLYIFMLTVVTAPRQVCSHFLTKYLNFIAGARMY